MKKTSDPLTLDISEHFRNEVLYNKVPYKSILLYLMFNARINRKQSNVSFTCTSEYIRSAAKLE